MPRFYAGHPVIPARQVAVATGSSAYADDDARENGNHPGSATVVPLTPTLCSLGPINLVLRFRPCHMIPSLVTNQGRSTRWLGPKPPANSIAALGCATQAIRRLRNGCCLVDFCRNGVTLAARQPGPFAASWMAFSICLRPAANGVLCRKTFRRSPRSSITFTIGVIATCGGT